MTLSIIVALSDDNHAIGKEGVLPWHLCRDLQRFKALTTGHPIIMGRKTHESIKGALPGRTNIVMSKDPEYQPAEGCKKVSSPEEALEVASGCEGSSEIFVIGGEHIYTVMAPKADRLYMTWVDYHDDYEAEFPWYKMEDDFFPVTKYWNLDFPEDEENDHETTFQLFLRKDAYPVHPGERWGNDFGVYRILALTSLDGRWHEFDYVVHQNEENGFVNVIPVVKFVNSTDKLEDLFAEEYCGLTAVGLQRWFVVALRTRRPVNCVFQ